mmetsp:Transcript_30830/g.63855  ORF Transcript_30830/g.63855 Transcript_30830/m.63855 type:complete len:88 (+) Transcript_30830:133-396(+)
MFKQPAVAKDLPPPLRRTLKRRNRRKIGKQLHQIQQTDTDHPAQTIPTTDPPAQTIPTTYTPAVEPLFVFQQQAYVVDVEVGPDDGP